MANFKSLLFVTICVFFVGDRAHSEETTEADAVARIRKLGGTVLPANGMDVTSIVLFNSKFQDDDLKTLIAMKKLQKLDFRSCNGISGEGFEALRKLPNMQRLRFVDCKALTNAGLQELANCKDLRHLKLRDCPKITGRGLRALAGIMSLESLELGCDQSLRPDDVKELGSLGQIKELDISDCLNRMVTDDAVQSWAGMKSLQSLHLNNGSVSAKGFAAITQCTKLNRIALWWTAGVDDEALEQILKIKTIEHLEVVGAPITDRGMKQIAALRQLKTLNVSGCEKVTDIGLAELVPLKRLEEFRYNRVNQITPTGVKALQKALPNLEIVNAGKDI